MKTPINIAFVSIPMLFCIISLGGCTTTYNATLDDFTLPQANRLADRIQKARVSRAESQAQGDITRAAFDTLVNASSESRERAHHACEVALQRADLKAWNTEKDILAVEDVWKLLQAESPDAAGGNASRVRAMLTAMRGGHSNTVSILDAIRGPLGVLQQAPGPGVRQAVQITTQRMDDRITAMNAYSAESERLSRELLDQLLASP